ncbi:MAG: carbohydrate-binding module family 20 domain-containing protein [Cystobacter sp.]
MSIVAKKRGGVLGALGCALALSASGAAEAGTYVHLFEWKWTDVARECETFLGPKGYTAVQVSPPNEHITGSQWWTRYQPVSYKLDSRGGSRAQFIDMVQRCKAVGVDIYADLVINHTASYGSTGSSTGVAGTRWSTRSHPMYGVNDYHSPICGITNYQDAWNVQNCDLSGLPDLNTGSSYVQQTLANYINDLTAVGVRGFRVDAAKHMSPGDFSGIRNRMTGSPFIFLEVIDLGGEPITASQYQGLGSVTEFKYSARIGDQFKVGQLKNLSTFGESWGFMPGAKAVVFTDNHDNQRGHGAGGANVLTFKDGALYTLSNVFMLGWPYGYPQVMSSYAFSNSDAGPPGTAVHNGSTVNCFNDWKCEHRWREIANMVRFRAVTEGTGMSRWWDNGNNQIAFARTGKGFVVINREGGTLARSFATSLPAGVYCNVLAGDFTNGTCSGGTISVDGSGNAAFNVPGMTAAAIHVEARVSGQPQPDPDPNPNPGNVTVQFTCTNGQTYVGQSVYVIGSLGALGTWAPASAVKLNPTSYPTWTGSLSLPSNTAFEWKCLKREEANPANGVQWQPGANVRVTTPASGSVSSTGAF